MKIGDLLSTSRRVDKHSFGRLTGSGITYEVLRSLATKGLKEFNSIFKQSSLYTALSVYFAGEFSG